MSIPFSPDRFWQSLEEMARIGATPDGGVKRLALSAEDAEARALLRDWALAADCSMAVDRLGSMYLTYPGADPDAAPVAVGSHLDSVPTGGKYDGPYGVLLGLEIVRALHEAGRRTRAPITVVNWTNEEGSRFSPSMSASGGAMGIIDEVTVLGAPDNFDPSITYGAALNAIGWAGVADPAMARNSGPTTKPISSRVRSWNGKASPLASSFIASGSSNGPSWSPAGTGMSARLWRGGRMCWRRPRNWCWPWSVLRSGPAAWPRPRAS
jgi:hydantoinase/carbamoylase family amidase